MSKLDISSIIGVRFGKLTAIKYIGKRWYVSSSHNLFLFRCDCGIEKELMLSNVQNGKTKSCGCYNSEVASTRFKKHGMYGTKEYFTWNRMLNRCYNKNSQDYKDYGGRGIYVCSRWRRSFSMFLKDMGKAPSKKHSLDRKNNEDIYKKSNCRWATPIEQANNKRNTVYLLINGEQIPVRDVERKLNLGTGTIRARLKRGWTHLEAATIGKIDPGFKK